MSDEKNKSLETLETLTVSSTVLSKIFEVSDRRIRQLAEEGVLEKAARGKYNLFKSIRKYVAYLKTNQQSGEPDKKEIDYEDERARHERIKRETAEITLAKIKGEVHESKDIEAVMNTMLANFKAKVMALPAKLAPALIARDSIPVIQNLIEKDVLEALEELSNYDPEMFLGDEYIAIDDYEEKEINGDKDGTKENT